MVAWMVVKVGGGCGGSNGGKSWRWCGGFDGGRSWSWCGGFDVDKSQR